MLNITSKQWFQIVSGIVSGLITGAALLNPLVGQEIALQIVAGLGIANIVINSFGTALTGQAALVKDVAAMPGVERVSVNAQASPALAAVAVDPEQKKVGATTPEVRTVLNETAKGSSIL